MARVFIDGFEAGDVLLWDTVTGGAVVATGISGMDGTYCASLLAGNRSLAKDLPAADEYYVAFKYRRTAADYPYIIQFRNGSTVLGSLRVETSGSYRWSACKGSTTNIAYSTSGSAINTTYFIEVYYKPHDSTGVFQVKVDGVLVIDFSGDTTDAAAQINKIVFGYEISGSYGMYIDDVVIDNSAWPGNTRIQAIVPTGAGNSTQWTPSAGSNYQCVDEKPPSETDYVSTNTTGHLDQFAAGDLAGSIGSIKCVQVQALAKAEGAPTPTNLQLSVRTGGSDFVSGDKEVPSASKQLYELWEENPDTVAAWVESEVNAAEIGIKAVA